MPSVGVQKISPGARGKIRITYICLHCICIIAGTLLLFSAYNSRKAERDTIEFLNLNITNKLSFVFYAVGVSILFSTLVGILGMILENGYYYIVYSLLMGIVCLTALAGGGSALDQQDTIIRNELERLIANYHENQKIKSEAKQKVDFFQMKYECCGIDNYTNWQDVEFGYTSLKVPTSCCKPIDDSGNKADSYCGDLCLPDHVNKTKIIFTEGCFLKMSSSVHLNIIFLGAFGLIAFLVTGFTFILTCYLIISKKMGTRV